MKKIQLPISEQDIRKLQIGDEVEITGLIITARDAAHHFMVKKWPTFVKPLAKDGAIYHCGPVVKEIDGTTKVLSAGPTTSIREEPYEHKVIAHYGVRIIIGKGGMGPTTLAAMKKKGAVYIHATGGAASIIAKSIVRINNVHMLEELGGPEAFWELEVKNFFGVVTMDSHGNSLHQMVERQSREKLHALIG